MAQPIQRFTIKTDFQKIDKMIRLSIIVLLTFLLSCGERKSTSIIQASEITQDSILRISEQWRADSLGCNRLRNPAKIRQLIAQLNLIGQDSTNIIQYLGKPNGKNFIGDTTVFYYFMGCSVNSRSSYNFYCNFKGKELFSTQTAIID